VTTAIEGRDLRGVLSRLAETNGVLAALLVAPDGLVIASALRQDLPIEAISALAATLGRELERRATPCADDPLGVSQFASEQGTFFLGATAIGFVVVLADARAQGTALADDVHESVEAIELAWRTSASA
jgi:predicted regulator of Ras-like GTPase activity (Roadblock/LC7/MglB family)